MISESHERLLDYFCNGYKVLMVEIEDLTTYEIEDLMTRFPYRMAVIMKYGDTHKWFDGKLILDRSDACWNCRTDLYKILDRYEVPIKKEEALVFFCKKCWKRRKNDIMMLKVAGVTK